MGFPDINSILDLANKIFALQIATLVLLAVFAGVGLLIWCLRKKAK